MKLYSPVGVIPKVGPKYKKYLEKLDIYTVEDLLYHFPFRYEDYSNVKKINEVLEGEVVSLTGELSEVTNIYTKYGKRLTKAVLSDLTGEIGVVWFNQHYLKKTLKTGGTYTLSGKVGVFGNKPALISPEIEETKYNSVNTGRLVPIYPETLGVSSRFLRNRINDVLIANQGNAFIKEFLPEEIAKKYDLKEIKWAFKQIHFPSNQSFVSEARRRFIFEELFIELINVDLRKNDWTTKHTAHQIKLKYDQIQNFVQNLPFKLTETQNTSFKQICDDLLKPYPMNRLLEGDVGSGKTVVAVITAYLTYLNGFKTIYMAPTEILARQHYETFRSLLSDTNAKVELLTGSTSKKAQDNKDNKDSWDILVGTHAVLYTDEKYKNVGLVIIDEQHRFGVEQRGKIMELGKDGHVPNILTMTATPIPRTLALTVYGDLEISHLEISSERKRNIITKVISDSKKEEAYKWVSEKDVPVFVVCPLIQESESDSLENVKSAQAEFTRLRLGPFKNKSMGLLHGRLSSKEKQTVIDSFKSGEIQVLVSTPVVEVGIDIPEAEIIIIESAERYGLASLHQLRGRVGRLGQQGYCFAIMSNYSKTAYERLKHLETVNEGLELAEIDMKIRGQGDIFSTMQHGFKKFKIANFDNPLLVEQAKISADVISKNIDNYPLLQEKLNAVKGQYVRNN